jgi:hypothetical protein
VRKSRQRGFGVQPRSRCGKSNSLGSRWCEPLNELQRAPMLPAYSHGPIAWHESAGRVSSLCFKLHLQRPCRTPTSQCFVCPNIHRLRKAPRLSHRPSMHFRDLRALPVMLRSLLNAVCFPVRSPRLQSFVLRGIIESYSTHHASSVRSRAKINACYHESHHFVATIKHRKTKNNKMRNIYTSLELRLLIL